ncbi:putative esterase [Spathaspora sp. JA1]|nr:putative esterase [Spathaspora sp. JA1]
MFGFFTSQVENYVPNTPIKFVSRQKQGANITLPELLKLKVPEFFKGYSYPINPILSSGHAQTAYTALNKFKSSFRVHYKRRILTIEDKTYTIPTSGEQLKYDQWNGESTIALDYALKNHQQSDPEHVWYKPSSQTKELPPRTEYMNPELEAGLIDNNDNKPLLVVLHGLSGGSYEAYIRAVLDKIILDPFNFDAIVINSRGCANHTITSPQLYNGLWTNDLRYVVNEHISKLWPNKRVYLMGFSLGGAILANYLGQEGDSISSQIKGACILGTPWDFPDSAIHLRESIIGHNVYSPTMCNNLLKLLDSHGILLNNNLVKHFKDNPEEYNIKFLKQFDNYFTAKLFGLNSADEYYRLASPVQRLMKVRVPTLILSSRDDPITGYRTLPIQEVELNPYCTLITTTVGGHLGWFTLTGDRWYTTPICRFLTELDNYNVDHSSVSKEDLPHDISTSWKYDRLVNGMLVDTPTPRTSRNQTVNNNSLASTYKWVRKLRTLASDPKSNDFLKLDYIEVNLNNSRKLINNVLKLSVTSQEYVQELDVQIEGNLIQLTQVNKELDWLDD